MRRVPGRSLRAVAIAVTTMLGAAVAITAGSSATGVKAVLEARGRQFFYAGDPFPLKISIGNDGGETIKNPVRAPLLRSFDVRGPDGSPLPVTGSADVPEPSRPDTISPASGYFVVADLTRIYAGLLKPGRYTIRWSADGIASDTIVVHMIPKYDASKEYEARFETDNGSFTLDFFATSAPIAVKAFIDMANAGFYDGLTFHKIVPDYLVEGGDPAGDGSGAPPFRYVAELSSVPVVAGTVLMKPVSPSPPTNGSQFAIVLRPDPSLTGQATAVGQIVDGLDVVKKISRLPSTQQATTPFYRPLKDILIRRVTVTEKPAPPAVPAS